MGFASIGVLISSWPINLCIKLTYNEKQSFNKLQYLNHTIIEDLFFDKITINLFKKKSNLGFASIGVLISSWPINLCIKLTYNEEQSFNKLQYLNHTIIEDLK